MDPHEFWAGNHCDVLKHVIFREHVLEQQKAHPEGIMLVDTHCGPGLYDLAVQKSEEYKKGILRISQNLDDAPPPVKSYYEIVLATDSYLQMYPGSPVFGEQLMRKQDEHRLCDLTVTEVKGLKKKPLLEQGDSFHPEAIEYFMPRTDKHPVIFIDPAYGEDEDFYRTQKLTERILERNPFATVIIWYPMIDNHKYRWGFQNTMKEVIKKYAKVGFYHAWVIVQKTHLQGSSVFIANPTKKFDDVMDEEILDWMSAILLKVGKSEYSVEQWMKKPKKKPGAEALEPEPPLQKPAPAPVPAPAPAPSSKKPAPAPAPSNKKQEVEASSNKKDDPPKKKGFAAFFGRGKKKETGGDDSKKDSGGDSKKDSGGDSKKDSGGEGGITFAF